MNHFFTLIKIKSCTSYQIIIFTKVATLHYMLLGKHTHFERIIDGHITKVIRNIYIYIYTTTKIVYGVTIYGVTFKIMTP